MDIVTLGLDLSIASKTDRIQKYYYYLSVIYAYKMAPQVCPMCDLNDVVIV